MLGASDQGTVVKSGPWQQRDGFVAETAIKLDRLCAKIDRLEHQGETVSEQVARLLETANQSKRFQAFEENLRNAREYKIDDLLRCVKELKGRLDQIEGTRSVYLGLNYRSFEEVDRKLGELSLFQARFETLQASAKWSAGLFFGALFVLATTIILRLV